MKRILGATVMLGLVATAALAQTIGAYRAQEFVVKEPTADGTQAATITAPSLSASYTLTLPTTDGAANEIMATDGSGVLAWVNTLTSPTLKGTTLLQNQSGAQPSLAFSEDPDNGTNFAEIKAPASLAADYTLTLPVDDGSTDQVLATNGSGVLSWASVATVPAGTGAVYSNGTALQSEAQLDVVRGGTGVGTLTSHGVLLGNGTADITATAEGATNTLLHGNTGAAPTYSAVVSADITDGTIVNADVNTSAAIAFNKLASLTSAHLLVGSAGNVATDVAVTGDVTITNAGVTAIGASKVTSSQILDGEIVNADINASAAIARSKIAAGTADHVVINAPTTGVLSSEAQLDRTRGGTGVSSTASFPTTASADADFVMKAGAQTVSGVKTFSSGIVLGNETLTVYDEGSFTPAVGFTSGGTPTYTTQTGRYTRIGNRLMFTLYLYFQKGSGSNIMRVTTGLTNAANISGLLTSLAVFVGDGMTPPANTTVLGAYINPNDNEIQLAWISTTGAPATALTNVHMDAGNIELIIQGSYQL